MIPFLQPMTAVIYARLSSDCPSSAEEQIANLREIATERGWTITKVFIDKLSIKKGYDRRPGQIALLERSLGFRGKGVAVQH